MANNENIKLLKAKVSIILEHPFFASLMMQKQFIEDKTIKTSRTNGKVVKYNPDYIETLTHAKLQGLICHELMHITGLHHVRRGARDIKQWNKACDYAINPLILSSGLSLPEGALNNPLYSNMSAEEIYSHLQSDNDDNGGKDEGDDNSNGNGNDGNDYGMGGVEDAPAQTQSEMDQAETEAKQELAQAVMIAKQQGKLPAALERLVEEVMEPVINWREKLATFLSEAARNDYSFTRPNTRYISTGFILPSLYSTEMGEVVLMVDTSGSIDQVLLNMFAGEMQDICSMFGSSVRVLYIDSKVAGEQMIEPDDVFKLEPKGGGGTDFKPGFDWLNEHDIHPKAVVYFTDMCCDSFPEPPDFPVLWAATGYYKSEAPFGEVVHID